MASMTGLSEQELQQLLGVSGTGQDPATIGLMPMPAYNLNDIYAGTPAQQIARALGGPVQGSKTNKGVPTEFWESQSTPTDQIVYRQPTLAERNRRDSITNNPANIQVAQQQSTINAVNPLDVSRLGLTVGPPVTPASRAIAEILVQGGSKAPTGGSYRGRPTAARNTGGLIFQPTPAVGPAPAGDPWATMRVGALPVSAPKGLVTGNAPRTAPPAVSPVAALHSQLQGATPGVGYNTSGTSSAATGSPVKLASGTQSHVGASGTAQGGRYEYVVQGDGSVLNTTTGRVTAPATKR